MGVYLGLVCSCANLSMGFVMQTGFGRLRTRDEVGTAYTGSIPVLITHWPSSLTLTHWLASSNSKSCNSSIRLAYSGSVLRLRFRFRASHSGRGRAVEEPEMVYTGTAEWLLILILNAQRYIHVYSLLLAALREIPAFSPIPIDSGNI